MNFTIAVMIALFVALAGSLLFSRVHVVRVRRSGLYPQRGQATDADIKRLIQSGRKGLAIRCHREVHGSSLKQAKHELEALAAIRGDMS